MHYDNLEYAIKRLKDTVIKDKDSQMPVFVQDVAQDFSVLGINLVSRKKALLSKEQVSLEALKLGYSNLKEFATYICRRPLRKDWKQGLSKNSLFFEDRDGSFSFPYSLVQPIQNKYPTFAACLSVLETGTKSSLAFSRDFAVRYNRDLIYREDLVGIVKDDIPTLKPQFFYLQEKLDEDLENAS